jgi:bloom syndrome protein
MSFRDEIITVAVREAEFSALSMCSTQQGYKMRIGETVDTIKKVLPELLRDSRRGGDEEAFDDAQEILDSMNRAYKSLGRKG